MKSLATLQNNFHSTLAEVEKNFPTTLLAGMQSGAPSGSTGQQQEAWRSHYEAREEYKAALTAEKAKLCVPEKSGQNTLIKNLKSAVASLRQQFDEDGNPPVEGKTVFKKRAIADGIEKMSGTGRIPGLRKGIGAMGVLAGVAVVAMVISSAGLGLAGFGFLGAAGVFSTVSSLAIFGSLGAGLYAGYKVLGEMTGEPESGKTAEMDREIDGDETEEELELNDKDKEVRHPVPQAPIGANNPPVNEVIKDKPELTPRMQKVEPSSAEPPAAPVDIEPLSDPEWEVLSDTESKVSTDTELEVLPDPENVAAKDEVNPANSVSVDPKTKN